MSVIQKANHCHIFYNQGFFVVVVVVVVVVFLATSLFHINLP